MSPLVSSVLYFSYIRINVHLLLAIINVVPYYRNSRFISYFE